MGEKKYGKGRPGGSSRPSGRRGRAGSGPSKGGGGGDIGRGTRHQGGTSSSSVHDGIRILVVGTAALALLLVGSPVAYLTWSGVIGS